MIIIQQDIKKRMVSGIKPSGNLTLGNYIGAIKPFISYQDMYELFVFVADLHSLTIYQKSSELKRHIQSLLKVYISSGLDINKCVIFKQSDIPAHNQLEWILTCNTNLADLTKMPQYKNFLEKHKGESTPTGMLMYPSLMNADILLYDADYVPVGTDQKPHVDLTRFVAEGFNKKYSDTFKLPEAVIPKTGAKIMSLQNPTKKMSKSESDKGTIYLTDTEEVIRNKIKKAVTDNESKIYYDPENKPGISNLIVIKACMDNKSISEIEEEFREERDYGVFKSKVADSVCREILSLQERMSLVSDEYIEDVLKQGREIVSKIADKKINKVYRKVGLR